MGGKHILVCIFSFFLYERITQLGVSGYTCSPEADCQVALPGDFVPDPSDCERYYVCIESAGVPVPSETPLSCPSGQYFDQSSGKCTVELTEGVCVSECREKGICTTDCPVPYVETSFAADSADCGTYYLCGATQNFTGTCPSETANFNGATCVADKTQCCICTPYCDTALVQMQDPCDCTSYYICTTKGQPHDQNRINCQLGYYFDDSLKHCVAGSCTSFCSDCAKPPRTTTITTTTTTTPAPTTDEPDCSDSFFCPTDGNFPRCNFCDPSYFRCTGGNATVENCSGDTVFNPSIQYPFCIPPENCPY